MQDSWSLCTHLSLARSFDILAFKLLNLQDRLSNWNWTKIGSLEDRSRSVDQNIALLKRRDVSATLSDQELSFIRSLYNLHSAIQSQISIKWQSKSRMTWLLLGYSNTSIFHRVTSMW